MKLLYLAATIVIGLSSPAPASWLSEKAKKVERGVSNTAKKAEEGIANTAKKVEEGVANTAKNIEATVAKAGKDIEATVAKAARDVGLTPSLSDDAAEPIIREAAKKPAVPKPAPTPPPETAKPQEKRAFVEAAYIRYAVEVVSTFETGGTTDAYYNVTLGFDKMGLTLGSFGWTIGTNDLQPLIKQLPQKLVEDTMRRFGKQFWEACNSPREKGMEIVESWQIIGKGTAKWRPGCEGVEAELKALLATPEMQKVQTKAIAVQNKPAIKAANDWAQALRGQGATPTVREYTLFLDTFVQNGGVKNKWTGDVNKLFDGPGGENPVRVACTWLSGGKAGQAQYGQAKQNAEIWKANFPVKYSNLFLLSWLIARESRPEYQRLVLSRRGTLLANNGYVNRKKWRFKQLEEG